MSLETVVILAAGEGTRMKSATPKVLHTISGRSLVGHVLHAVSSLSPKQVRVIVGAGREEVEAHISEIAPTAVTVFQEKRGGTGHATQLALDGLKPTGTLLVLAGDTPMLTSEALSQLLKHHHEGGFTASVLTAEHPDPTGYGRIVRADDDSLLRIVEERDADDTERDIYEVNSGVYAFDAAKLAAAIGKLKSNNSQGELYLTDVIEILRNEGGTIAAVMIDDFIEILGVNDRVQLAESAALLRDRINEDLMREGVSIIDPLNTWVDSTATVASDVTLMPGTAISGSTTIASGAIIGPRTTLVDCTVGAGARVIESRCAESIIGDGAQVGPYTYLRPGTKLLSNTKVGAYVEMKNATLGEGSKVPHLSYVGDAVIGEGSNIGAATIFVNYDGVEKHYTVVGDHVRIGSDSMLVAPVTIGDGAYTAAGSVITEDVPPGAIGVGRAKQRNVIGWVLRKRSGTKSAEAASRHSSDEQKG
ncbi:MAG: bifunctional UDP-N-acetylglucosamine diphosphorylase/glucosamine-1-phosphate N-acetyltransferase GlmU [Candidatus Planktophila sp.]|jgi:bifunctional UDP-N-acetylglucosamine pyrophosphorylase / glucosamine-1-phosphate N-acetyltransferase|tara:strand:- start:6339 stop:7766 length:1428 start_codon:yes stop_codon:yes gene_type:complete